jgi:hypothetical protein
LLDKLELRAPDDEAIRCSAFRINCSFPGPRKYALLEILCEDGNMNRISATDVVLAEAGGVSVAAVMTVPTTRITR